MPQVELKFERLSTQKIDGFADVREDGWLVLNCANENRSH